MKIEHIGDATLYLGDCLEILPTLEGVDAVVTDPPYGTEELGGGYGRRQNHDPNGRHGARIQNDTDLRVLAGIAEWSSLVLDDGWLIAFCGPRRRSEATKILENSGWESFGEYVWDKGRPGLGYTIRYSHETALVNRRGSPYRADPLLSVCRWPPVSSPVHPHEKPTESLLPLVLFSTPVGGVVIDPSMGVGTTGVACANLGRRFIGIEIEPKYFDIACKRIEDAYKQPRLFDEPKPEPVQEELL